MKKKIIMAALAVTFMMTATACGSDGNANEPVNTGTSVETEVSDTENETESRMPDDSESEAEAQAEDMEQQYKDMAAKFAVYCEHIYLDYENLGTVTTGDITIIEDTRTECRINVRYIEPDIELGNLSAEGGEGYMEFVIDKETSQGQMTVWNYLGNEENPADADMMGEASGYYGFPEDAVFDFKEGVILSGGSAVADVNEYFNQ